MNTQENNTTTTNNQSSIIEDMIDKYGDVFEELLSLFNNDVEDATNAMEDCFEGEYETIRNFAEQLVDECYNLSDFAKKYFDYQKFANDLISGGDYYTIEINDSIYVFRNE